MSTEPSTRLPVAAAGLFLLVVSILVAPMGAIVIKAVADTGGGTTSSSVTPDLVSDQVAATAAEFRIDESGSATYSIPIYGVPGTAGVAPKLSLTYSSQGGYGPLGKGWSLGGLSSISRCRATREAGDFIGAATPDGNPKPINFTASDRYCLDGQRLIPAPSGSPVCASASGMTVAGLRTEIESFQRVCAYTPTSTATNGPAFFTAERKDGSISWYGDRNSNATANRPDGYFETNSPLNPAAALLWAQTRFQDSTGNYIDFFYAENPSAAGTREHLINEIHYTGRVMLTGQTTAAKAPYAKIAFTYSQLPAAEWSKGYSSGGNLDRTHRLVGITACNSTAASCAAANQARYYQLTYAASPSGSGLDALTSLQECRDSSKAVCMAPTAFTWSQGKHGFASYENSPQLPTGDISEFAGFKLGDVDGDGRQDLVYLKDGRNGSLCSTEYLHVAYGQLAAADATSSAPAFLPSGPICTPAQLFWGDGSDSPGDGSWHLLDYNGDGRDDLFVKGPTGQGWRLYPSQGRTGNMNFVTSSNLIAGLSTIIPSVDGKNDQPQLADLNGDGLTDVVYPRDGALRARIMERQGGSFVWGGERIVQIDDASLGPIAGCGPLNPDAVCGRNIGGAPTTKTGFMQMADFNGDAASDLLLLVSDGVTRPGGTGPGCDIEPLAMRVYDGSSVAEESATGGSPVVLPYVTQSAMQAEQAAFPEPCPPITTWTRNLHAMTVSVLEPSTLTLSSHTAAIPGNPETIALADANGDGLTDVFYRPTESSEWRYRINTGTGMQGYVEVPLLDFEAQTRFADVNGDGRADILHPFNGGAYKAFNVKYALPNGGFGAETWLPGVPGTNANAMLCTPGGCDHNRTAPMFADLDGDGNLDYMTMYFDDNINVFLSRSTAASRYAPRDVITRITNGLGAQTNITYAPLTNKELYRRDSDSRNSIDEWGRLSPVMDLLAPSYAVARVSSSSPRVGDPAAEATVHYRYTGARVQSGGRGFLGFRLIETVDPNNNQGNGYVVTATSYAQNFPYVGMPVQTVKKVVSGQAYFIPTCLNGVMTNACFATPGQSHTDLGGSWFSDSMQHWESAPDSLATQVPLHVRTGGTEEKLRDPFAGGQTSRVVTTFGYGAYGNVSSTSVDTFTAAETAPMSTVLTANTYTDDPAKWRLGRLTGSTVTHSRPGQPDVVRTANFAYSMAGAATGQLTVERTQYNGAVDQDLRKEYTYDDYGNQTVVETCANPASACSTTINFHPATATTIQRYARTTYDSLGRFPVTKVEPFWSGTGAIEKTVSTVVARNIHGDVTQAYDLNGVDALAVSGAMGRPYYTWAETVAGSIPGNAAGGAESWTTYRFCGAGTNQVNCPAGAKFRQQVSAEGAGRQWTYFDVLGRPMMKAAETFNTGVIGKDIAATCSGYDATGKPERTSNPFFLAGTSGVDGPTGLDGVCAPLARLWTTTTYDLLGRPTQVDAPDNAGVATVTNAYHNNTTGSRDPRTNLTNTIRNGKGEVWQTVDANGLLMVNYYTADGNLGAVHRNAGRGVVANQFTYDQLGRKILQTDPDSGLSQFQYNALGELIVQIDNAGQRIENEYDGRGRVWRRTVKTAASVIETQSTFTFDTAANGVGQLTSETITGTYAGWNGQTGLALGYSRSASYDTLGRGLATTTTIDGVAYSTLGSYDALGRAYRGQDVSGRWIKTEYNARGFVRAVCNSTATDTAPTCPADANTYVATLATDEWGHVTKERRGNSAALEVNRSYFARNGRVAEICGGTSAGCNLMKEGYGWDRAGNLSLLIKGTDYVEEFTYDSLNRLRTSHLTQQGGEGVNQLMQNYEYDQLGNICHRDTYGWASRDYTYAGRSGCGLGGANSTKGSGGLGNLGPHQVTALVDATTLDQYYDANGNMTQRYGPAAGNDRAVKYSASNQAYEITMDTGARQRFWYGASGARYKSEDGAKKTLYLGNVEIVTDGGLVTTRRTIAGVMLQTIVGSTTANYYLFHDQLGSLVRIANAAGAVVSRMDFLAFGGRRNTETQAANGTAPSLTPRGFTGHEMLDSVGLIHMNGRIYDFYLGRFLQPDPLIQAPGNAQSWNAYTYVFNNPLVYTDPTGNFSLRQFLGIVIAVVAIATQQYWALKGAAAFWYAVGVGFVSGYVSTGTLQGGLYGAFAAGLFYGIGTYFQAQGMANSFDNLMGAGIETVGNTGLTWGQVGAKVLAHGAAGGVMSRLQGGKFGHGFASAGFAEAVAPGIKNIDNSVGQGIVASLAGGTASVLSGGKFANGATTAAFSHAFNHLAHRGFNTDEAGEEAHVYKRVSRRSAIDVDAAVEQLNQNALLRSSGYCARYVRWALEAGGAEINPRPQYAANYGPILEGIGFKQVELASYFPMKGDVVVFPSYRGQREPAGHIAMYNGSQWISDFKQRDFYVNPAYKSVEYRIYRP